MTTQGFKAQSLSSHQTIGEILRSTREGLGFEVEPIAEEIKVAVKYLHALEKGAYNDLPSPIYIKNYLKLYAKALGISWERIKPRYEKEIATFHRPEFVARKEGETTSLLKSSTRRARAKQGTNTHHHRNALVIPRLLKLGGIGILVFALVIYFVYGLVRLVSPPALVVTEPADDKIVTERDITVEGSTAPEVTVEINGQAVAVETDGSFTEEITLVEGLNTIQISAKTKLSREQTVIRNILYNPSQTEPTNTSE